MIRVGDFVVPRLMARLERWPLTNCNTVGVVIRKEENQGTCTIRWVYGDPVRQRTVPSYDVTFLETELYLWRGE